MRSFFVGIFLLVLFIDGAAARCAYGGYRFIMGMQTNAFMEASSGKPCAIAKRPLAGSGMVINSVAVLTPPDNGTAGRSGAHSVIYRSRPGFKGKDSFVFGFIGTNEGKPGVAKVLVTVDVQ